MKAIWWAQIVAVMRLEIKKTFFARRGLWIYLLALAPVALFTTHALVERSMRMVELGRFIPATCSPASSWIMSMTR